MLKPLGLACGVLACAGALAFAFGPREPAELVFDFDASQVGSDVDAYLAAQEARFDDITPGTQKRIVWAGARGTRTPLALVYIHGFSATSEEIRPVPDQLATALGANLVYTRLTGHGRSGAAMAQASVADWTRDTAEALEIARRVGEEVIILSTSTGGTLVAGLLAQAPSSVEAVKGAIFISPNFGINNPAASLLTWPWARHWVGIVAGEDRSFTPANDGQARYWTTQYPTVATLPMAALVRQVVALDFSRMGVDALFWYHPDDKVVRADITQRVAADWAKGVAEAETIRPDLTEGDDPYAHVIAGEILSPSQTEAAVAGMLAWIEGRD